MLIRWRHFTRKIFNLFQEIFWIRNMRWTNVDVPCMTNYFLFLAWIHILINQRLIFDENLPFWWTVVYGLESENPEVS